MKIKPIVKILSGKKLIGIHVKMNLISNKTVELWQNFSPNIKNIKNKIDGNKISMQIYNPNYFKSFSPANVFTKWATVEVSNFDSIPNNMNEFELTEGLYAVFLYKGNSNDNSIYHYIFSEWIPNSRYQLDDRPHFEVLSPKYKNNDPKSEEEIWIPITLK
ncbi:GyrI-like domain-containing protein [Aquimarina agarivorans]|uniref:GyrI-like domain-containing protein n=1 Tax=Aquimarina agarivorans TaxID=980584 RepID=UPI000248FAAC|nr:GyrI-like domain-containing protein [Aquimarina agarivorans]